jgi:hypothetical protein
MTTLGRGRSPHLPPPKPPVTVTPTHERLDCCHHKITQYNARYKLQHKDQLTANLTRSLLTHPHMLQPSYAQSTSTSTISYRSVTDQVSHPYKQHATSHHSKHKTNRTLAAIPSIQVLPQAGSAHCHVCAAPHTDGCNPLRCPSISIYDVSKDSGTFETSVTLCHSTTTVATWRSMNQSCHMLMQGPS